ncbi:hypothetical protein V5P93_001603 [Actinokineospora auranticolor]|uniref:hypothetical protein n=1 Tax=Actinokineospora auranticolor TaxID=155976 RepID=UPI0011B0375F|nr:hypothetical protein [Actinokineospora auranticolor]
MAEPVAGQVAAADPTTAAVLGVHVARANKIRRLRWAAVGSSVMMTVAIVLLLIGDSYATAAYSAVAVIAITIGNAQNLRAAGTDGWIPAAVAAMAQQPWRPVTARVVRARPWSTLVEIEDQGTFTPLRVRGLPSAFRAMISRTGTAWVIGPHGPWTFLRVTGSHTFWAANAPRRTPSPGALNERVDGAEVHRRLARHLGIPVVTVLLVAFALLGMGFLVSVSWPGAWIAYLLYVLLISAIALRTERHRLVNSRLPRLIADAHWTRFPVRLEPWQLNAKGMTRATAHFEVDGTHRTALLPAATADVLGAATQEGALWFAQAPETGKTVAVGFPNCPLLAVAEIR